MTKVMTKSTAFAEVSTAIERLGLPANDLYDLPASELTFPDNAHYRIEISGIERVSTLEAVIDEAERRDIPVHRLISTVMGATLLSETELLEFAKLAAEARMEVILTPGPRSSWDTGRQLATPEGIISGLRIRGADNLRYLVADIKRATELGFRGFLVTDEGALWLLSKLRAEGFIPKDTVFKISIYAGHANPAGAKLLEELGATTFNPLGDLTLPMFASLRKVIKMPIDIHVILSESFGGFNRMWETPELARVTAPCYFKIEPGTTLAAGGGIYKPWTSPEFLAAFAREKVKYAEIIRDIIERSGYELRLSVRGAEGLALPKPPK